MDGHPEPLADLFSITIGSGTDKPSWRGLVFGRCQVGMLLTAKLDCNFARDFMKAVDNLGSEAASVAGALSMR